MRISVSVLGLGLSLTHFVCQSPSITYKEGKALYERHCAPCHGYQAEGFENLYPSLHDTTYLISHRDQIPCWVKHGIQSKLRYGFTPMPPNAYFTPSDLANLLNYINTLVWHMKPFTLQEIESDILNCRDRLEDSR